MDWGAIQRLFEDDFTSSLIDRQVNALERAAVECSGGILVSELRGFSVVLSLATRAVIEHGAPFEGCCCALIRVVGKVRGRTEVATLALLEVTTPACSAALPPSTSARGALCERRTRGYPGMRFRGSAGRQPSR